MPPKTHTVITSSGVPTARIICDVTRKIPLPMTVPTTIDTAGHRPKERSGSLAPAPGTRGSAAMGWFLNDQRHNQCDQERRAGPDGDIPGEGNGSREPHV